MARPSLVTLETVVWVARLGSFSATARKLNTTQPAISARVRELEASLGTTLFERRGRHMEPTIRGRQFIQRIEPLLSNVQEVLDTMIDPELVSGVIRIGTGDISMTWMQHLIEALQHTMPAVTFELQIGIAGKLLMQLEDGKLDIVVIAGPGGHLDLHSTHLGRTQILWVMAADRWRRFGTEAAEPALADLLNCGPIWLVSRQSRYFAAQAAVLREQGAHLRNVSTCDSMSTIVQLVTEGGGIGFLPRVLIEDQLDTGRLIRLPEVLPPRSAEYTMVYAGGRNQALVQRIVELAVKHSAFKD